MRRRSCSHWTTEHTGRGRCSASKEKFFRRLLAQPHDERILGCFPHEWQSSGGTLQASCSAAVGLWAKVLSLSLFFLSSVLLSTCFLSWIFSLSRLLLQMKNCLQPGTNQQSRLGSCGNFKMRSHPIS
ncbi:uncharacterized protein LOC122576334 isoform X1 [Bombus pyrosoma]|uniref:uncharacterized protein LOC122576334 isoform X1 n=1 Tax=Bombus pyrosoma TaxID=396416 RepID=UPI001CB9578E|nr:uncharacterized protein LOC122576334 isoform X1 [Bombus pyrosoma]